MFEYKFKVGDKVRKCTGDYQWGGEVCSAFLTPAGKERYVIAHAVDTGYVLHIYAPSNIRLNSGGA